MSNAMLILNGQVVHNRGFDLYETYDEHTAAVKPGQPYSSHIELEIMKYSGEKTNIVGDAQVALWLRPSGRLVVQVDMQQP